MSVGPLMWETVNIRQPSRRDRSARARQVHAVFCISVATKNLHTIGVIPDRILRRPAADPELEPRTGMISGDDHAFRPDRVGTTAALERADGALPSRERGHHH